MGFDFATAEGEQLIVADAEEGVRRAEGPYDAVVIDCMVSGIIPRSCRSEALLSSRLTPTLTLTLTLILTLTLTLAQTLTLALAPTPRPSSRAPPPSLHRAASSRSLFGRTNATGCVRRS